MMMFGSSYPKDPSAKEKLQEADEMAEFYESVGMKPSATTRTVSWGRVAFLAGIILAGLVCFLLFAFSKSI